MILQINEENLKKAADAIREGKVVVFPTESFYGLGADGTNEEAIRKVFKIKKRSEKKPILLIIGKKEMLYSLVEEIPEIAERLMERFWPGPLTIVFKAKKTLSPLLTSGTGKIGIRLSGNPFARRLSQLSSVPITGTSANLSGKDPCRSVEEVISQLNEGPDVILDGGYLRSDLPSTVVDITEGRLKIIREGIISKEELSVYA